MTVPPATWRPTIDFAQHRRTIDQVLRDRFAIPDRDRPDVVQDVLLAAWRKIDAGEFRPSWSIASGKSLLRCVKSWLFGITWRQALKYRERARHRYEVLAASPAHKLTDTASSPFEQVASRLALAELKQLPPRLGDILRYTALGYTPEEIAAELGENPNNVVSRLRIGRRRFREARLRWRTVDLIRRTCATHGSGPGGTGGAR